MSTSFLDQIYICPAPFVTAYIQQSQTDWVTTLSALLTPTIALLGLVIAGNQWITARRKLKLDLYDKRLAVYEAVRSSLGKIVTSGKTSIEIEHEYLVGISGAKWLFGKEIVIFLDKDVWKEITHLTMTQGMTDGAPPSAERSEYLQKAADSKIRLNTYLRSIDEKFLPYLLLKH